MSDPLSACLPVLGKTELSSGLPEEDKGMKVIKNTKRSPEKDINKPFKSNAITHESHPKRLEIKKVE